VIHLPALRRGELAEGATIAPLILVEGPARGAVIPSNVRCRAPIGTHQWRRRYQHRQQSEPPELRNDHGRFRQVNRGE
jgi:hypothetical protein